MILRSTYQALRSVHLPAPNGRQFYMHAFNLARPTVPPGFEDYLEPVTQLCAAAGATDGVAYLTVDEKVVQAGMSQRRPKPHVDGCFVPEQQSWSHGGGSGWLHSCNQLALPVPTRMAVIVAASAVGCRVWKGEFSGVPKNDGDLSHIADQLGEGEIVPANVGYLLSPDCVHESMILERETPRTFIRIALPHDRDYL